MDPNSPDARLVDRASTAAPSLPALWYAECATSSNRDDADAEPPPP
jgi:hypothetical protein